MNGLFKELEGKDFFVKFISEKIASAPSTINAVMRGSNVIDAARLEYAHKEYTQSIDKFSILLKSKNPDHYKRSGALLHALYQSKIIVSPELESSSEELEAGFTRVNLGDAQHILKFVEFYENFYNEVMSFEIAYRCCASYDANPRTYNMDYLHNVCRYLKCNSNLTVDSLFMLFKSLMH